MGSSEALQTVLMALAAALMVGLFVAPFTLYPLKVRLTQRARARRIINEQIEELRAAVERLGNPYHMIQLGAALLEAGQLDEAVHWLQRALERDPENLDGRFHLGRCYFQLRRYEDAGRELETVVQSNPTYAYGEAFFLYARSLEEAGDGAAAREAYQRFLRYYPNHPEASVRYAQLLDQVGEHTEAEAVLRQMVSAVEGGPEFQKQRQKEWLQRARRRLEAGP